MLLRGCVSAVGEEAQRILLAHQRERPARGLHERFQAPGLRFPRQRLDPAGHGLLSRRAGTVERSAGSCYGLCFAAVSLGDRHLAHRCRRALGDGHLGRLALRKCVVACPDIDPSPMVVDAGTAADGSVGGAASANCPSPYPVPTRRVARSQSLRDPHVP